MDHLTELIDVFTQTQPAPTSETVLWFEPQPVAAAPADEDASDGERARGTGEGACVGGAMSVEAKRVKVKVFAISIVDGQTVRKQLVVQRVVEPGPSAAGNEIPLTGRPVGEAVADRLVEPVWERVESLWVTPYHRGLADTAKLFKDAQTGWHDLVLGRPAERVALGAGFSPVSAELVGDVAARIALPGDGLFNGAQLLIQFTGFVVGAVSGVPLLANACVSSFAHDVLAEATVRGFCKAIGSMLTPARGERRLFAANELGPDGAQARQLHSDPAAAASRRLEAEQNAAMARGLVTPRGIDEVIVARTANRSVSMVSRSDSINLDAYKSSRNPQKVPISMRGSSKVYVPDMPNHGIRFGEALGVADRNHGIRFGEALGVADRNHEIRFGEALGVADRGDKRNLKGRANR